MFISSFFLILGPGYVKQEVLLGGGYIAQNPKF